MKIALTIGLQSFSKAKADRALLHQEALAPIAETKPKPTVLKYRSLGWSTYVQKLTNRTELLTS